MQKMRSLLKDKRGLSLGDAPGAVMVIAFLFLILATVAYIASEYGDALTDGSTAQNVTEDLNQEIEDNTSIAGIVLTIVLVGIVLGILVNVFAGMRGGRM